MSTDTWIVLAEAVSLGGNARHRASNYGGPLCGVYQQAFRDLMPGEEAGFRPCGRCEREWTGITGPVSVFLPPALSPGEAGDEELKAVQALAGTLNAWAARLPAGSPLAGQFARAADLAQKQLGVLLEGD